MDPAEEAKQARAELERISSALAAIENSTWWRAGAPLRAIANRLPWAARQARRSLRFAYWTATGRLAEQVRERCTRSAEQIDEPRLPIEAAAEPAASERPAEPAAVPEEQAAVADTTLRAELGLPPRIDPVPVPEQIVIPAPAAPLVSVVVPTFGQLPFTLRCLASIAAAPPAVPIEVIVVDDASGDAAVGLLSRVSGIRLIVRESNLGFVRCCNETAKLARGAYVMLLNNDTEVMPGAIDHLFELLSARPDIGLTGARLLYPDGTLQEAGGIIWRDGNGWTYGRNEDPRRPEFNYIRETDYISGAAIMLPRAEWERLGGFDELFAPAYCEDSDLAFRVRAGGRKVVYHPEAIVIHEEGVSHGTDPASGVRAYQPGNVLKLAERWSRTLRREHLPTGHRIMRARDRSLGRRVTLVIAERVPEPDRDPTSAVLGSMLDALLEVGRTVKFLPTDLNPTDGYTAALQRRGIEVVYAPWWPSATAWIAANGEEIDEVLLSGFAAAAECLEDVLTHCRAPLVFYEEHLSGETEAADPAKTLEHPVWRFADEVLCQIQSGSILLRVPSPCAEPGANWSQPSELSEICLSARMRKPTASHRGVDASVMGQEASWVS